MVYPEECSEERDVDSEAQQRDLRWHEGDGVPGGLARHLGRCRHAGIMRLGLLLREHGLERS